MDRSWTRCKIEWEIISKILEGALRKKCFAQKRLFLKRRKAARQPVDKHIAEKDKAGRQNPTVETNLQQFWDHLWEDEEDEDNYVGWGG